MFEGGYLVHTGVKGMKWGVVKDDDRWGPNFGKNTYMDMMKKSWNKQNKSAAKGENLGSHPTNTSAKLAREVQKTASRLSDEDADKISKVLLNSYFSYRPNGDVNDAMDECVKNYRLANDGLSLYAEEVRLLRRYVRKNFQSQSKIYDMKRKDNSIKAPSVDTSPMSRMKHSDDIPGYTGSAIVFNDGEHIEHNLARAFLRNDPIDIIAESEIALRREIAERKQKKAEKELAEAKAELEAAKKAEAQAKQNAEKERNRQTVKNTASAISSKAASKGNSSAEIAASKGKSQKYTQTSTVPTISEREAIQLADAFLNEYFLDMNARGKTGNIPDAQTASTPWLSKRLSAPKDVEFVKKYIRQRFRTVSDMFKEKHKLMSSSNSRSYAPSTPSIKHDAMYFIVFDE